MTEWKMIIPGTFNFDARKAQQAYSRNNPKGAPLGPEHKRCDQCQRVLVTKDNLLECDECGRVWCLASSKVH